MEILKSINAIIPETCVNGYISFPTLLFCQRLTLGQDYSLFSQSLVRPANTSSLNQEGHAGNKHAGPLLRRVSVGD